MMLRVKHVPLLVTDLLNFVGHMGLCLRQVDFSVDFQEIRFRIEIDQSVSEVTDFLQSPSPLGLASLIDQPST